jgi:16S rRNA C967 or C1407 C5-methylase (RsmB/RsmF family)
MRRKKKRGKSADDAPEMQNVENVVKQQKEDSTDYSQTDNKNNRLLKTLNAPVNSKFKDSLRPLCASLSKPLPLTFRIRNDVSREEETRIGVALEEKFGTLVAPVVLDQRIYQARSSVDLSKSTLSKMSLPLKEFLVEHSLDGTLARQEFGSMLPVLALTRGGWMKAGSRVLDLCASPGSKTLQALEIVGPKGKIKANDVNATRLEGLQAAVQRSGMQSLQRIKYTQYDATQYPIPTSVDKRFDVILCDVPCSGDGTIRKDPHILPNWMPSTGNALHSLQVRILVRALQCLKVGGVVSYSTCSLNPVEDEAVVAAAIEQASKLLLSKTTEGSSKQKAMIELVDWPQKDGFCRRPGVDTWEVAAYTGDVVDEEDERPGLRWYSSYGEASDAAMEHAVPSMWTPTHAATLNLERCTRLWPQDHDTGGFFVALLRRNR